ncbi:MAG: CoA transferase [Dehalococcoidia bacterium]
MRVFQLGSTIACAEATLLLQRFGAQVVQTGAHDPTDQRPSARIVGECLAFGKDRLTSEPDVPALRRLLDRADVVVDDRPLSYWRERGLDLRELYAKNPPRSSWCGITPYGLFGAGENWAGCELTAQASGPMMNRLGEPGQPPLPIKGPQAAITAGWHAALVIAACRFDRDAAGRLLDVSIQECQYMHSELGTANWHFNGVDIGRISAYVRHSVYPALDGPVHMLFHDREWPRVARMIGREDLAHDSRFMTRHQRAFHLEEVDALLVPWFMERTRAEAVTAGQAAGMPIAFDQTPAEILADPQVLDRNGFETVPTSRGPIEAPIGIGRISGHHLPTRPSAPGRDLESLDTIWLDATARPRARATDSLRPLAGVRILDLTNTWAAPRGATLLGDLGAEVIKIEGVEWMDMLRGFTDPPTPHDAYPHRQPGDRPWDRYLMWLGMARNKLNAAVELTRPEGKAILDQLVGLCDVVMTNMSLTTRAKYGLVYERLAALNPSIIFATLSAYGDEGPRSDWRLFGDGQAAMGGIFFGTGYPGGESLSFGAYGDPVNGVALAFQIAEMLALRQESGRGAWIDVSSVETCLTYSIRSLVEEQLGEDSTSPVGFDGGERWPHGVFPCVGVDRWVAISCGSDAERAGLQAWLAGLGSSLPERSDDRDAWQATVADACRSREAHSIEHALHQRNIPCQKVMRASDVDGDPVLTSRNFIAWQWREDLGTYPIYAPFWLIDGRRPPISLPAARFGEHNEYVLGEIARLSEREIDTLRAAGVIANAPLKGAELGVRPG